jgi:anti-anti-sigma factor
MTLRVTTTVRDGTRTVTVEGVIDAGHVDELRRALGDTGENERLILDLTGVDYLYSAGIQVIYDHLDRHPELLVGTDSVLPRLLSITGLDELFTVRKP